MGKSWKRMMKYFGKNPSYNSFVHLLAGMGIGFLLTYPLAGVHPVRWGVTFLLLALVGHLWASTQ